ncbi:MAG: hypothetical protein AB1632_14100 [Nitrospirota bacterium]
MKKLFKSFETTMMAVAFAEAGEFETARELLNEDKPRKTDRPSKLEKPRVSNRKELRVN